MDCNKGLEVRISKEGKTTIITMGLEEIPPMFTRIPPPDQTSRMGIIAQTMEDPLINAQTNHLIGTIKIDLEMGLFTNLMGTGETTEISLVLHQLKDETSHKTTFIANKEMTNLITLRSADLTIDLLLALRVMNKSFRRTIIRHHLMCFALPQPMILLTKNRIFAR